MGRYIASIASGIIVGLITAITAGFFLQAATWSSIHGGMSGTILAVLFVGGMAAPPVCGFLAGRAIYRRPLREPTQMTASTGLNCPHCGCSLKPSANYSTSTLYTVVECPIHGPFHFGPNTDLTLGRPEI